MAAAYYHAMLAGCFNVVSFEQLYNTVRRSAYITGQVQYHTAYIYRVKTVHILCGRDGFQDLVLVDVTGQGQLYNKPIDIRIVIEIVNGLQQLFFGYIIRVTDERGFDAHIFAGLHFACNP